MVLLNEKKEIDPMYCALIFNNRIMSPKDGVFEIQFEVAISDTKAIRQDFVSKKILNLLIHVKEKQTS